MPSINARTLVIARWVAILAAGAVSAGAIAVLTSDVFAIAWALWPYVLFLCAGLVSDHFRMQALVTGASIVVSALSIVIYIDATGSSDAQLPIGLAIFPVVQAVVGVVLLGIAVLFRFTVGRRASNNAMDSDTVRSALRAPHGARHRGR